eukprot:Clim_evm12s241 gene=Clim_evmTU12s241
MPSSTRKSLPQLEQKDRLFVTDGGQETVMIFKYHRELPEFAAFTALADTEGRKLLEEYYDPFIKHAKDHGSGFVLESPTWRASGDWGKKLGYDEPQMAGFNRDAIELMKSLQERYQTPEFPVVVSGNVGPRGDGYKADMKMTASEAEEYHRQQIEALRNAGADMITAMTINYLEEGLGIVRAAEKNDMPVVVSFTLETDGKLPTGQTLEEAINEIDRATDEYVSYYMINCAHPDHFKDTVKKGEWWTKRVKGIRANASRQSHAELDEAEELDDGNPEELGQLYRELLDTFEELNVVGGCCGTDDRHIAQAAAQCANHPRLSR